MEATTAHPSARRVLLLVVVLTGALVALSILQWDREVDQGSEAALRRAELHAGRGTRRKRRGPDRSNADPSELRERLERATKRAEEAEAALRRSEAERAMLRAGRPETQLEAELRQLRQQLRESQALAAAAGALAGGGDLQPVKERLALAAREVDEAVERAKVAEGRADAAEDRARAAGDSVTDAERRIDALEATLREVAAAGVPANETDGDELRERLADADRRVAEAEAHARDLEARLAAAASLDGQGEELLAALEARLVAAEGRAAESAAKVRSFEDATVEEGGSLRHRLGVTAAGRKLAAPPPPVEPEESEDEIDLRAAIVRGLRVPLRRASGLALSLQRTIGSGEGKAALRQLSSSLRRLDRLTADLYDVQRIVDGSLPLQRRRTDLAELVATAVDELDSVEERVVRFEADTVPAFVDPDRARQIVDGMLDAARERARSDAAIIVRVRRTEAGALVTVEDGNRTAATIGPELSLAARLAELHGTELTVEGASVRVVFPRDEAG
jgi:hypothetical protein